MTGTGIVPHGAWRRAIGSALRSASWRWRTRRNRAEAFSTSVPSNHTSSSTNTQSEGNSVDYFQGVVTEYLRVGEVFVDAECLIQLDPGDVPLKDRHWYCDIMAVDSRKSTAYLCEVTYSTTMHSLQERLQDWENNWAELRAALYRDSRIPEGSANPTLGLHPTEVPSCIREKVCTLGADHERRVAHAHALVTHLELKPVEVSLLGPEPPTLLEAALAP